MTATASASQTQPQPGAQSAAVRNHRKNNFDFLRLFLAALVVLSHSYAIGVGSEAGEPLARLLRHRIFDTHVTFGMLAVDGFFIVSGYLITASWERKKSTLDYFHKRVARIYPGFVVCAALCVYALPPLVMSGDWHTAPPHKFLFDTARLYFTSYPLDADGRSIIFLGNAHPRTSNGSLWSIPYEFWCYIGVALLGVFGAIRRSSALVTVFVIAVLTSFVFSLANIQFGGSWFGKVFGFPPFWARLLPCYLSGMVLYRLRDTLKLTPMGGLISTLGLVVLLFVPHGWSIGLPTFGAYLLLWLATEQRLPHLNVTRFGDWSYGTYLYAFPIQQLLVFYNGGRMNPLWLCAIALPLSLLAGALSWHAVERWFVKGRTEKPAPKHA
ncbi:MAG: acyltransferase [Tepidisphaeraceae bacterium]